MNKLVIGFAGRAGSGKDTAANILIQHDHFVPISFAKPLKEICTLAFMLDVDAFTNREKKEKVDDRWGLSPREMCQKLGTDFFRKLDDEFWIKRARIQVHESTENCIFTDVRFPNEADFIRKELKGIVVFIDADKRLGCSEEDAIHPSEKCVYEIKKHHCDFIIENNGSMDEFIITIIDRFIL